MNGRRVFGGALVSSALMALFPPRYRARLVVGADKKVSVIQTEHIEYRFLFATHSWDSDEAGLRIVEQRSVSWPRLATQLGILWAAASAVVLLSSNRKS